MIIQYEPAHLKLNELNAIFKKNKSNYWLIFDHFEKINGIRNIIYNKNGNYENRPDVIFLCLYLNEICVSTITCIVYIDHVQISSKTQDDYTGKKYNLLLRSIIILLASIIRVDGMRLKFMESFVTNSISIICLRKYFVVNSAQKSPSEIIVMFNVNKKKAIDLTIQIINVLMACERNALCATAR